MAFPLPLPARRRPGEATARCVDEGDLADNFPVGGEADTEGAPPNCIAGVCVACQFHWSPVTVEPDPTPGLAEDDVPGLRETCPGRAPLGDLTGLVAEETTSM